MTAHYAQYAKGAVMASRFETYETTENGKLLADIIMMPEMISEYVTLSRLGKPAVQAIANDVAPVIEALQTKAERDAANQFVGWRVAQIMRGLGYILVQERGRVTGAPYRTGAVWSYEPGQVKVSLSLPEGIVRRVDVRVKVNKQGNVVADIDASDVGQGQVHRVHRVLKVGMPINEAVPFAVGYAERHGFGYVHVLDGERHLPIKQLRDFLS
jgi:hypothetical protein